MRPVLRALLLAALVASAGCSGVFGGGSGASETTTTERGPLAPGLTEDGLADVAALVDAHASSLDGESVTFRERRVQRYGNGTLRWRENVTFWAAANRTRFWTVTDATGRPLFGDSGGSAELFADGDRVYRSIRTSNGSWTEVLRTAGDNPESPGDVPIDPAQTDDAYVLFNVFDANSSENVREQTPDARRYLVRSSTLEYPDLLASRLELDEVRNATLEVIVTPNGFVEEYRIEYEGTHRGAVVRGEATFWYENVGETTVEAPGWLDEVEDRNGTSEGEGRGTSEGGTTEGTETTRNATETT